MDRLKEFSNTQKTLTSTDNDFLVITTGTTETKLIKQLEFRVDELQKDVTEANYNYSLNGISLSPDQTATLGTTVEITKDIFIDTDSEFKITPTTQLVTLPLTLKGMLFNDNHARLITDSSSETRALDTEVTYSTVESNITNSVITISGVARASSAFAIKIEDVVYYARVYANALYIHKEDGTLFQESPSFATATQGMCWDGDNYIYAKASTNNTVLQRYNISTNTIDNLALVSNLAGQGANQGSFTLHYNNHLYIKDKANSVVIHKINIFTLAISYITVPSQGTYSAGATITVARDGTPYLVEYGAAQTSAMVLNLTDDSLSTIPTPSMSVSSEYGNIAIELAKGIVAFAYGSERIVVDLNISTGYKETNNLAIFGFNFVTGGTVSFAQLPTDFPNTSIANVKVTTYAFGVLTTGVASV